MCCCLSKISQFLPLTTRSLSNLDSCNLCEEEVLQYITRSEGLDCLLAITPDCNKLAVHNVLFVQVLPVFAPHTEIPGDGCNLFEGVMHWCNRSPDHQIKSILLHCPAVISSASVATH